MKLPRDLTRPEVIPDPKEAYAALLAGTAIAEVQRPTLRAKGRHKHTPGTMNKTEARYAAELDALQKAGGCEWWAFEPFKFRLAKLTTYTPDFAVMFADGLIELVDVKGHPEDDARVKVKVAAEMYFMFRFVWLTPKAKKAGGGWKREEF